MNKILESNKIVLMHINRFLKEVVFKIEYYLPLITFLSIGYLFNLLNKSVSIDDMAQVLYYGDAAIKIKGLRWGEVFISRLLSTIEYTPFINKFVGILFFVLTTIILCSVLYFFDTKKEHIWKYSIASCIFITYPLINEFWEYDISLYIPLELSILVYGLLYQVINNNKNYLDYLFIGILYTPVIAGYESPVFAYVSLVLMMLMMKYGYYQDKDKGWFLEGLLFAAPLAIGFVLKYVIGYLIIFILGYTKGESLGDDGIRWLSDPKGALTQLVFNGWYYGIRALSYMPITEFAIALISFVAISLKNYKKKNMLVLAILFVLSLFFLPILQGAHFGYRTAQTIQILIFITVYLLFDINIKYKNILVILGLFLALRQSVYLHELLALNNQRSDNELAVVRNIGYELYSKHDISKEVYFVGNYNLGENINSQIYVNPNSFAGRIEKSLKEKFGFNGEEYNIPMVSTNVSSTINWGINAPWYETLRNYFSYCGYDLNINTNVTSDVIEEYYNIAKENNMKPQEIIEFDNYIIVFFGD